jgi:hypothetical protein
MKTRILLFALLLLPGTALAFDVILDIDIDGDPRTINLATDADSALVAVILMPTQPDELIREVNFGLGGTCWACWQWGIPFTYGVDCELFRMDFGEWHDPNPLIATSWFDISLCYGCCNMNDHEQGYHFIFSCAAAGEGFVLNEPMVLTRFLAWVSLSGDFQRCPHTTTDLVSFPNDYNGVGGAGNRLQIGNDYVPTRESSWSTVKSLY